MTPQEAFEKHVGELTRFASGLVGPWEAEDVVAEACLKAFASPKWNAITHQRAYLYRSVMNHARMRRRASLRRRTREARAARPEGEFPIELDPDVLDAVKRLSVRQRAVTFLTYWEDLRPVDIAARLGISAGSVRRHLHRAHVRLREVIDD
ncbi:MAG: RNA polymerase sigma factor [Acidimicrobiia bacterium]|nr:RNA polymerase sigma factor [Acidimicrobiia bacterium]